MSTLFPPHLTLMVNIQCHSFIQVIGLHSFIPLVAFLHSFLPRSSSWFGYHLAIIHSGYWVVHLSSFTHIDYSSISLHIIHSFIHSGLFVYSFVRCSFVCPFIHSSLFWSVHSFIRRWPAISFVDIVHELCKVEWYRGGVAVVWCGVLLCS